MKKISKVLLLVLTLGLMLTGCGDKAPEVSLQEQGKNYYEVFGQYKFDDIDEMALIGYSKEEAEKDFYATADAALVGIDTEFGAVATDAQKETFKNSLFDAIKRTTGTVEVLKEEKSTGTIKITSNYVDMEVVGEKILAAFEEALTNDPTLVLDKQKTYDVFLEKYAQILNEYKPSDATESIEVEFEALLGVWHVKNEADLDKISELTMKN